MNEAMEFLAIITATVIASAAANWLTSPASTNDNAE